MALVLSLMSYRKKSNFYFFETVINRALEESQMEDINLCIDMYDYLPSDIARLKNREALKIYFLAYPYCTKEQIKYNVVHYAKKTDWIAQVNETYLEKCVDRFFERNKLLQDECQECDMKLIDTKLGQERDKILDEFVISLLN